MPSLHPFAEAAAGCDSKRLALQSYPKSKNPNKQKKIIEKKYYTHRQCVFNKLPRIGREG
jgi:hypothetical protein